MKYLSAILDDSAHLKIAELMLLRYVILNVYTQNLLKNISINYINKRTEFPHYHQVPTTYLSIKSHVHVCRIS